MLKYHLYVSASRLDRSESDAEIERLVARAQERNRWLELTGALIFSGSRFAQFLEGPEEKLDLLMSDIRSDPRHHQLTVLSDGFCEERRFKDWSLAYSGLSMYVDRHIKALVGTGEFDTARRKGVDQLMQLILSATESMNAGRRLARRGNLVSK